MAEVYVFYADGMEEIEALTPVDVLRRAGNTVVTVSVMGRRDVMGAHGIRIEADAVFENTDFSDGDLFVLPGGGDGMNNLRHYEPLCSLLCEKAEAGKRVAAICASPFILEKLGLLKGKKATIYPTMSVHLKSSAYMKEQAVTDGLVTTGAGPGAAFDFSYELVKLLNGEEACRELRNGMVYPY